MGDKITLFGRIDWTTYGLKTITIQDAIDIIRNGTYYIDDNMRSGMSGTLREITEKIQTLPEGTDLQRIKQQTFSSVSVILGYKVLNLETNPPSDSSKNA